MSDELTVEVIARLTAERDAALAELKFYKDREEHFANALAVCDGGRYRNDWGGALQRLIDERDAARAIIEGSMEPPTDEEIEAHYAAGGAWLVEGVQLKLGPTGARQLRDAAVKSGRSYRWVPIRDGRPCARPTVATGEVKP